MQITRSQLLHIMPNATKRVDVYLPLLNRFAQEFHIDTPLRWAHYLAQIAHESAELRYTRELASGAAYDTGKLALRLGNTPQADGDGQRYKGRGLIQITGRTNYQAYSKYCGVNLLLRPELLEQPFGATRSSMWFFCIYTNCLFYADRDDLGKVTRLINGGYNGLESRLKYLTRAKEAFGL